ncbi:MAG TPA: bifunctional phosphopantothenoylcysteine decarboxylase/phosphopantothenate--cysteine ligase CoaBC [Proteiniphilum sp.]|nr:bifunctional phosphopantothenoylcysteine decarboxylase/phosphopantothenate--cysteine ligase CoaBC [Proteiniphilum sp.]HPD86356.1 bifunctional phosphopantothenoylcysteine decarboxylase/phosphopantothenate--cysteine ligase CoaBC [Proteiniphilum sp.]HPJ49277.1 bifunctional phosphopantothenoylcysteine decarboxylase/phosphopantothenate--cysteine ligase CoaBC [Proteiniphilum sp.]HPR20661.1 bifunctional phosphopantothenoylcysteine decarboxylase/phosphopantothenate--cysteine ligase CoaBC [Proteiniphi
MSLQGKHIVLGISGSIAAYKSAILTRLLIKKGAEVQIVITPAGKQFITPVTLSALSGKPVISEFFASGDGTWHSHVELGLWADMMVVAPATAATLGKMAHGIADNMLITTYLSMKAPVFVAPAMDLDMFRHVTTQRNLEILQRDGVTIIDPAEGELASHLEGKGRMEEPEKIVAILEESFAKKELTGKKILITAGPTYERIDPVRYIGNFSSGKMGFALAEECVARGAEVLLITGPTALSLSHPGVRRIDVESAEEMHDAALKAFPEMDAAILSAAVADYRPAQRAERKIKRKEGEGLTLTLTPNPDIAAALGRIKREEQLLVGFALETDNEEANALGKMEKKQFDHIVVNSLRDEGAGFGHDTNKITILSRGGGKRAFELQTKKATAKDIIDTLFAST